MLADANRTGHILLVLHLSIVLFSNQSLKMNIGPYLRIKKQPHLNKIFTFTLTDGRAPLTQLLAVTSYCGSEA